MHRPLSIQMTAAPHCTRPTLNQKVSTQRKRAKLVLEASELRGQDLRQATVFEHHNLTSWGSLYIKLLSGQG